MQGKVSGRSHSPCPVLCPQEPDQVYEGITFDDFLKVGVWEGRHVVGAAVVGTRGAAGWSGDWHLGGKGSNLGVAFKTI